MFMVLTLISVSSLQYCCVSRIMFLAVRPPVACMAAFKKMCFMMVLAILASTVVLPNCRGVT